MYYVQSIHDTKVENVRITPLTRVLTLPTSHQCTN
jgi:hypothetical protein